MSAERLELVGLAAAGIAHDLNNQLHLILNHLASPDVDGAREAVRRCSALTGSLLAFCRGELPVIRPVDPVAFLRNFIAQLRLPAGISLVIALPDTLPAIAADPLSLSRALTNLVSNAIAAMNNDGILRISASPQTIEVADSGPGIPPELQRSVFEPFFTTKGGKGTGLGLAIVRDIMRDHRGSVTVHSTSSEGTAFRLRFRPAQQR